MPDHLQFPRPSCERLDVDAVPLAYHLSHCSLHFVCQHRPKIHEEPCPSRDEAGPVRVQCRHRRSVRVFDERGEFEVLNGSTDPAS